MPDPEAEKSVAGRREASAATAGDVLGPADEGPTPDVGPAAELDDERSLLRQGVGACVLVHREDPLRRRVRHVVNER